MKEKILPPMVLMLICAICCGLLVFAYNLTYVDTTGVITDKMNTALAEIYGTSDGFEMLKDESGNVVSYEGVTSVLKDANGNVAFEITADGYNKGGIYLLVGMNTDGTVKGMSIMTIGETPGLGTKVQDKAFLDKFTGAASQAEAEAVDNITGASRSSNGIKAAVTAAVNAYNENKEAIFGE